MHDSLSRLYLLEQIKKDGRFECRLNVNPAVKVKLGETGLSLVALLSMKIIQPVFYRICLKQL